MTDSPPSQVLLEWQTLDSHPHERSSRWYLIGGILIIAFAAYGIFDGSWTTALLAILIGGIYFLMRNAKPRVINIRITGLGVQAGSVFTPWNMCRDFWILVPPPSGRSANNTPELHISPQKMLQREIVAFINDIDPALVRETLLQFLPERAGMEERFLDSLARLLKL